MRSVRELSLRRARMERLEMLAGDVNLSHPDALDWPGPLIGITSSRLGHSCDRLGRVCRYVAGSVMNCRARHGSLLVAIDSAIEPLARRAAELFDTPLHCVTVDSKHSRAMFVRGTNEESLSRDEVLIGLADSVDAVYVRRRGKIGRFLHRRLSQLRDASTRVAVHCDDESAAESLIAVGAVGWYLPPDPAPIPPAGEPAACVEWIDPDWMTDSGWLVHCTRGCRGAWPGQTERQFHDGLLLGCLEEIRRGPIDALRRIVRSQRLIASTIATCRNHPVVCFSEVPVAELIRRRCYRSHLGRWDYEPYGVAIRKRAAHSYGVRPVIYGDPAQRETLVASDRYRFHPRGSTFDWRQEREWRCLGDVDLSVFDRDDVRLFVGQAADLSSLPVACPWKISVATGTSSIDVV